MLLIILVVPSASTGMQQLSLQVKKFSRLDT